MRILAEFAGADVNSAENALKAIASEKKHYARYLIRKIPGNRLHRGSAASEQNHSSVISFIFGDKDSKNYMEHIHLMIRDLFTR